MNRTAKAVLFLAAAAWLAGCPIGCPKPKPRNTFVGPDEDVPVERVGPCTFRATPPLQHGFDVPDEDFMGVYSVEINGQFIPHNGGADYVDYDIATAIFTVLEPVCSKGVETFVVRYHTAVKTVNE